MIRILKTGFANGYKTVDIGFGPESNVFTSLATHLQIRQKIGQQIHPECKFLPSGSSVLDSGFIYGGTHMTDLERTKDSG